jgi:hypothetical protein
MGRDVMGGDVMWEVAIWNRLWSRQSSRLLSRLPAG